MRREIAAMRDRVAAQAHRLDLPVQVMHVTRRPPGRMDRWASSPTPRAAVGFLTTTDPIVAAGQLVDDWCDAQIAAGHQVTGETRRALQHAAGVPVEAVTA